MWNPFKKKTKEVKEVEPDVTHVGVKMGELIVNPSDTDRSIRNLARIDTLKLALADLIKKGEQNTDNFRSLKAEHDYREMKARIEKGGNPWPGSRTTTT